MTVDGANYYRHMYRTVQQRDTVWRVLADYVQREISPTDTVLDVGAGYCNFINHVTAGRRLALDVNPEGAQWAAPGVEFIVGNCTSLEGVADNSIDLVFASNVFEHLSFEEFSCALKSGRRVLRDGAKLVILQPNFYYAYRVYFHDHTHRTIFTHVGLSDALTLHGFEVITCKPRFLPMSLQGKYGGIQASRVPFLKEVVYMYIRSPFKPFAKQMYLVSRKVGNSGA